MRIEGKADEKGGKTEQEMVVKRTLTNLTSGIGGGANLIQPKLDLGYIVAATVGIVVLMFVWKMGGTLFAKGSQMAQGYLPMADTPDFAAQLRI